MHYTVIKSAVSQELYLTYAKNKSYNTFMVVQKIFSVLSISLLCALQLLPATPLAEQFKQYGYVEMCNKDHGAAAFDALYACFDELIDFLYSNPIWSQKLYAAKERFIRSKDRNYYSTDFFGFYDESAQERRHQISFYYSIHFHDFIRAHYPALHQVSAITKFFYACFEIQKVYGNIFEQAAAELDLKTIFYSEYGHTPILFKVIKYLPAYTATKPHYDGSVFSLFLDSTDNQSLLFAPYKSSLTVEDFSSPVRTFTREYNQNSMMLIPGALLTEFSIYPTPHIVTQSGTTRYATIAFAMRPHYMSHQNELSVLPHFKY